MRGTDGVSRGLSVRNVTVRYGALAALSDVDVEFAEGQSIGLIGPNGAGKTTLLNAISGFARIASGQVFVGGTDVTRLSVRDRVRLGIVRSFQTVRLLEKETVFTNVALGCERLPQPSVLEQMLGLPRQWRARKRDVLATTRVIEALGLEAEAARPVNELAFAGRRLTELARILVAPPQFLLLDEPAAGFDFAERRVLADRLKDLHQRTQFTMIVVEHDVEVVRRLCSHAVALDSGMVISRGTPATVLEDRAVQVAYFGTGRHA